MPKMSKVHRGMSHWETCRSGEGELEGKVRGLPPGWLSNGIEGSSTQYPETRVVYSDAGVTTKDTAWWSNSFVSTHGHEADQMNVYYKTAPG